MPEKGNMMATANRPSGIVVPHQPKWYQRLAAALIFFLVRCMAATIRFRLDDRAGWFQTGPPVKIIFGIWHNRLALSAILYERYVRKFDSERRLAALVSASKDGGLLAQIFEYFGIEPVRGSSSRRGGQALVELTSCAERGLDLAMTPDGPRGPRYEAHEGIITAAQITGLPIVPVSYHLNWKIRVKSWDGFLVPLPLARCSVILGKPLTVPREISDEQREGYRTELEKYLNEITRD